MIAFPSYGTLETPEFYHLSLLPTQLLPSQVRISPSLTYSFVCIIFFFFLPFSLPNPLLKGRYSPGRQAIYGRVYQFFGLELEEESCLKSGREREGEATGKSGKGKERKEPENNQSRKKASTTLHGAEKAPHPAPLPVAFPSASLLV